MKRTLSIALSLLLAGCGDSSTSTDAGADSPAPFDVSVDARDAADVVDAAPFDASDSTTAPDARSDVSVPVDALADVAADVSADVAADAPPGVPLEAPARTWTWIPIEGAVCDDGSPTGVGVNLAPDAPGVMVFLSGGGACWDYATCVTLNTSAHGPFTAPQFAAASAVFTSSIFDRALPGNPFAAWSFVFVPYCTGDLHAGDRVANYTSGSATRMIHHRGRANLQALLPRLAATLPPRARVALVGASSGGFGAALNHDLFRAALGPRRFYVVDDSGPLLQGDAISPTLRAQWFTSWNLSWLDAPCPACRGDLSRVYTTLAARHSDDRTALVMSRQDSVMRALFGLDAASYDADVVALASAFNGLAARRAFVRNGSNHTILGRPADPSTAAADGTAFLPWLAQMVTDDTAWTAHGP